MSALVNASNDLIQSSDTVRAPVSRFWFAAVPVLPSCATQNLRPFRPSADYSHISPTLGGGAAGNDAKVPGLSAWIMYRVTLVM